jgi:hypothetical protein
VKCEASGELIKIKYSNPNIQINASNPTIDQYFLKLGIAASDRSLFNDIA